jgi:hypothetical protein
MPANPPTHPPLKISPVAYELEIEAAPADVSASKKVVFSPPLQQGDGMGTKGGRTERWLSGLQKKPIVAASVVGAAVIGGLAALTDNLQKLSDVVGGWNSRPAVVALTLSPSNTNYEEKLLRILDSSSQPLRTFQPKTPVGSDSDAVFLVTISNPTKRDVIFTKAVFDVQEVGATKMPTPEDPLPAHASYSFQIGHSVRQQSEELVPPFRVQAASADSFDLELSSASKGHGLVWLMRVGFITTDNQTIYTERFQLVLLGAQEAKLDN